MSNQSNTSPGSFTLYTTDVRNLSQDYTAVQAVIGGSLSAPTVTVIDQLENNRVVTLHGSAPSISGTKVNYQLLGTDFYAGGQFQITVVVTMNSQMFTSVTYFTVPQ